MLITTLQLHIQNLKTAPRRWGGITITGLGHLWHLGILLTLRVVRNNGEDTINLSYVGHSMHDVRLLEEGRKINKSLYKNTNRSQPDTQIRNQAGQKG